ncbi:hypothetical protein TNCV_903361 [Trichonephila clavipes]|nr:hypothetical protein TNCV_903361 [Trichonephila clavipes]
MTLRLIAKGTFCHGLWIQEHDRDPFEKTLGAPTRLNVLKFILGTLICHINGTDIEGMMIREDFGQQLHNKLFSLGVEVNDLGGLQAVDNDSKRRHKRDEIREMDSLEFDEV